MSMRTVDLYWNHICILHNFEKAFLAGVRERLADCGIDLRVRFFGMGYERHLASYLREDDAVLPDVVVSADLEVFENAAIASKLGPQHPCASWVPLKDTPIAAAARRAPWMLPFVAIPLTAYGSAPCGDATFVQLMRTRRVAFGGVDNSAGKTVVKALWQRYGEDVAREALARCRVEGMPIAAFQAARMGAVDVSIAPSLYGLRADGVERFHGALAEGPLVLPTYFCAREELDEDVARAVCEAVVCTEALDFYVRNGDLAACPDLTRFASSQEGARSVWAVDAEFALGLGGRFYEVYRAGLPQAEDLS